VSPLIDDTSIKEELESLGTAAALTGVEVPEVVLPTSHHVVLNHMRFHYLDWGRTGPPILFLHGGGLTAHTYDLVCLALRPKYHCISLDQRGHGDSEWSPVNDYSTASHVRDISAFIDRMGWERLVLVGMSMGGLNSIAYAGSNSHRLAGLVIVDVGPELRNVGTDRLRDFRTAPPALDSVDEFVERAMQFNPRRDPKLLRRSLLHNLRQRPDGKWTWKWDPGPRIQAAQKPYDSRTAFSFLWDDVERIDAATLVLRGADSDVFHDEDAQKLVSRLAHARWVKIPDAGHTVQGDNPAAMVAAMRGFLTDIDY
jgi:pimeloyl-ACP methyl ester carboxylesterase